MSQRLNEYLVREAADYLEQMGRLLADPGAPDLEQLLRLARGARGSVQMAGADVVAALAERLEEGARAVDSRRIAWSEELRRIILQTVHDLQLLLGALSRWGSEEEGRLLIAMDRWSGLGDGERPEDGELDVVDIASLFFDDSGPHVLSRPPAGEGDGKIVAIDDLLLRGDAALDEALALRDRLESLLHSGVAPEAETLALVDELFDLVRLGRMEDPAGA